MSEPALIVPNTTDTPTPAPTPIPTVGRTVLYRLTELDVSRIQEYRERDRRFGNTPEVGQEFPMVIVRTWGDTPDSRVNGHVLLDGPDSYWVTSVQAGDGLGEYFWPVRT